ncbi:hypothetical protein MASR1M66_04690 [Aminivibrio sp.]
MGKKRREPEQLETITAKLKDLPGTEIYSPGHQKKDEIEANDPEKNGINIPLQNIYKCLEHLVYDEPIYVLCESGERSTIGASYLKVHRQKCVKIVHESKHCKDCRGGLLWPIISNAVTESDVSLPPDMRDWLPENHFV